ncbi:unnamed protein product [marine sediment metagenome]|uniref:Peptide chain release factor domain-containing protein n=1 Tax=marine sediment metagenome TaxID=412755 RepID=X1L9M5_9ZZZZ
MLAKVTKYREYKATAKSLEETRAMLGDGLDGDMAAMVKQEVESLETQLDHLLRELKLALLPKDPDEKRDIIMEIRAGAGGDEAGLFSADLFRMYSRYAQAKGWGIDIINLNESGTVTSAYLGAPLPGYFLFLLAPLHIQESASQH